MTRFSLVTNASMADDIRIRHTVPNWIRVFGDRLQEILIVVDESPPSGRIAKLHGAHTSLANVLSEIERLEKQDARIRHVFFPGQIPPQVTAKQWFQSGIPMRCQGGTPILAFVRAFESASSDLVLRADCDMLFVDHGWVDTAAAMLESNEWDVIEPPRLGQASPSSSLVVSTRAMMVHRPWLRTNCLPMRAHRIGPLRRIHRRLQGRPTWIALEQMVERERDAGRLRHIVLQDSLGYSMHVPTRDDVRLPHFESIVERFERGDVPLNQRAVWDYVRNEWPVNS